MGYELSVSCDKCGRNIADNQELYCVECFSLAIQEAEERGKKEGYDSGYDEGFEAGEREGRKDVPEGPSVTMVPA